MLRWGTMLVALIMAPTVAFASSCPAIPGLATDAKHCAESERGLTVAGSEERAKALLALAEGGAQRFQIHFGREAARFAIMEIDESGLASDQLTALNQAGYKVVLPWLSADGFRKQVESSVRRAVEASTAGQPPAVREAALKSAMAQLETWSDQKAGGRVDGTVVPHELGHLWLISSYWPEGRRAGGGHYGGPGPDWLDELAAVLHEPESAAIQRREQFVKRFNSIRTARASGEQSEDRLLDLVGFFTSAHPVGGNPQDLKAKANVAPNAAGATVRVLAGPEAERAAGDGIRFYLQSRLVADFVIERSGDSAIFGKIAEAIARNGDFGAWLANAGRKHKLPKTLSAFEREWLAWIDRKYPAGTS